MIITAPKYYYTFRCIAGDCPDSCCKEWEVAVDDQAAAYYRSLPGELGDRLRQVLRTEDGQHSMIIQDRRCPMWRSDGLCRIQAELGHDALCRTCRDYPRLRHDYGDFAELGLELSCPEAARLIFSGEGQALCVETVPGGEAPDYDEDVMSTLKQSREDLRGLLEDASYSPEQLLAIVLLYSYAVQNWIDGGEPAVLDGPAALAVAKANAGAGDLKQFVDYFKGLEILTARWQQRLTSPDPGPWTEAYRHLIRYFVDRWWLQAVSDYDLVCRGKLIVIGCLLIRSLGGDAVQTAQLFSKEIENDPDNVEAILDGAYTAPALTDLNLLGLLLAP